MLYHLLIQNIHSFYLWKKSSLTATVIFLKYSNTSPLLNTNLPLNRQILSSRSLGIRSIQHPTLNGNIVYRTNRKPDQFQKQTKQTGFSLALCHKVCAFTNTFAISKPPHHLLIVSM